MDITERKAVLCVSGGLDSYGMFIYLRDHVDLLAEYDKVTLLHFQLGSPYEKKEYDVVQMLYPRNLLKVIRIDGWLNESKIDEKNYIIPVRNFVMAHMAVNFGDDIFIAGIKDENYRSMLDKNSKAFNDLSKLLTQGSGKEVRVMSPFFDNGWNKVDILEMLLSKGLQMKSDATTSCYHPTQLRCGKCKVCMRRWLAERCVLYKRRGIKGKNTVMFPDYGVDPQEGCSEELSKMVEDYTDAYQHGNYEKFHLDRITRDSITYLNILLGN